MNNPHENPPKPNERVMVLTYGAERWIEAYRVDYRNNVAFPDFVDKRTSVPWRFCRRITGLEHVSQLVTAWRPLMENQA